MSLRLGFAGTPEFAVHALNALADSRHVLAGVLTQPDRGAGRGRRLTPTPVKARAVELGLEIETPVTLRTPEALRLLAQWRLDALVVVAYGLLIPADMLRIPRHGAFNIHASLLPRWRGAAPIQRCLLAADAMTGISIMQMDAGLDTGPVCMQKRIDVEARETGASLHDKLAVLGAHAIVECMNALERGDLTCVPQSAEGAIYASKLSKAEAEIDWRESASQIDRQVRAFNPAPIASTHLAGRPLRVFESQLADAGKKISEAPARALPGTVLAHDAQGLRVACGEGWIELTQVQWAGGKRMHARELAHAQSLQGARLGDL